MAGTNFVLHSAGWLEGGLVAGYEKFVMDADQLGMHQVIAGGVDMSANGQAMNALREVGPGSHFLGCAHTQENFETAFYRSPLADNNTFEQWQIDGALDTRDRAAKIVQQRLNNYQQPTLDPAIAEALDAFIATAKAAVPDSNI
jgi:trimethylamine--corrinoid protein Co-methyltransferase